MNVSSAHDDDECMRRAASGDASAFSLLVAAHGPKLASLAARVTGVRADAEDVVQEAFIRLWRKAPEWHEGAARVSTWLYRVVLNLCLDRRRKPVALAIEAAEHVVDPAPRADSAMIATEQQRRVASAIAALPERQRLALQLCHFEELTNIEAAAALELSVGAIESLLVRARRSLRDSLVDLAPVTETRPRKAMR
jgi:RNA polymerase sigma-70 factor (ECF subfamily)